MGWNIEVVGARVGEPGTPLPACEAEIAATPAVAAVVTSERGVSSGSYEACDSGDWRTLGVLTVVVGVWALVSPQGFSEVVNFPPDRNFVHDVGAFQLGIGVTLLLALIWVDAFIVALAGYAVGGIAHTVSHVIDHDIGGSPIQTVAIGVLTAMALVALVARWQHLQWVVGAVAASRRGTWPRSTGRRRSC